MNCFSLPWLEAFMIYVVVLICVVSIVRLLVPWAISKLGADGVIASIVNIVLWGIVTVLCIYIAFALFSCLLGGGLHFPRMSSGFEDIARLA